MFHFLANFAYQKVILATFDVIEAIEVIEAIDVIEAIEVAKVVRFNYDLEFINLMAKGQTISE